MTVHAIELDAAQPVHRSFRLTRPSAPSALQSQVRPALVLPEREGRDLLAAAQRQDVSNGGRFSAGPAGVQLWSGPWEGESGSHGTSEHLGSVDWSYDTPVRHYITIYRVMVTTAGVTAGESTTSVLGRVVGLTGLDVSGEALGLPVPPPRDPFRSSMRRG